MKIFLTHGYFLNEDVKEQKIMRPYAPLGLLYISSYLEENGFNNEVFDSTFSSFSELTSALQEQKPDLVGIYTNLMTKINVVKLVRYIKQHPDLRHAHLVLGGPEVRYHTEKFLNAGADSIVLGEGEETMLDITRQVAANKMDLMAVKGIVFIHEGKLTETAARPLIKDISILPLPNRKKINIRQYIDAWRQHHGYGMISVSTMRGCPYTCKWCSRAVYGGTYRRRKPRQVAEEMLYLKQTYNPDMIWFVDDVFTIHHRWLFEFVQEVKKLKAEIPYEIISRADRLNEEVIKALKQCGCKRIWIGAESGSQKIIDAMDRRVSVSETARMIHLAKAEGIEAGTFIMLGYPGETKDDIRHTIQHLVKSNPTYFTITVAYPITGTPLYEEIKNSLLTAPPWETSTDRDLDFKRTHSRKYYEYAVRWVVNKVELKTKPQGYIAKIKLNLKALLAELLMFKESLKVEHT